MILPHLECLFQIENLWKSIRSILFMEKNACGPGLSVLAERMSYLQKVNE